MLLTVAIQAGGESRRMGQDKALLAFMGKPLIARVIDRVSPLAAELLVTTNRPGDYRFLDLPLFEDILPGSGALGGLFTALRAAHHPLVAVVACDMPFVNRDLLAFALDRLLATDADVAIPRSAEGYEPFHAVYRRATCLPAVEKALEAGERRLISWFPDVIVAPISPEEVLHFDPRGITFWNLNTPEEFRQAEALVKSTVSDE
jgi:molybdopterin-guanine dinucleotide biosynthesis protein A